MFTLTISEVEVTVEETADDEIQIVSTTIETPVTFSGN